MTAYSLRNTPLEPDIKIEGHSSSVVDQTETVAFGYRARALVSLNSGSNRTFGYPAICAIVGRRATVS